MTNRKTPTTEQLETTEKAYKLRAGDVNDIQLSEMIGVCKVTLYTRLRESNWKKGEIIIVNSLFKELDNEKST